MFAKLHGTLSWKVNPKESKLDLSKRLDEKAIESCCYMWCSEPKGKWTSHIVC